MKLYILALDSLDYDITLKLKLKNLLQKQFGKLEVPINEKIGCPLSSEVWASFLCAEHIKMEFKRQKHGWTLKILEPLKRKLPFISLGIGKKVTGGIAGFGVLKRKTWVDNPNVREIEVPYYSYKNDVFHVVKDFHENKDLASYRRRVYWLFLKQTTEVVTKTKVFLKEGEGIDVVFAYIHFPDAFHHAWLKDMDTLKKYYLEINEFVRHLKGILKDTHLLIISDHGWDFSKDTHSDLGFISSNKKMVFPKSIIELGKHIQTISEENLR
jgi:hypothetical protein